MASGQNIVVSTVLLLGMGGIFVWMKQNNVSTTDMTFTEACFKAVDAGLVNVETCEDIAHEGYTWNTKIPCVEGFKESKYFMSPRQLAEGGVSWGTALDKSAKTCIAQLQSDADYDTWSKVMSARSGRSQKRVLGGGVNKTYGAGPNKGPVTKVGGSYGGGGSYKSCSGARIAAGFLDVAECSGNPHLYDGEISYCHNAYYNGWSQVMTVNLAGYHLAVGCIIHDICLQWDDWKTLQGFTHQMFNQGCKGCDQQLSRAAHRCMNSSNCNDSWSQAYKVAVGMAAAPNRFWDAKGCSCTETCCGGDAGDGSYEGWCCPRNLGGEKNGAGYGAGSGGGYGNNAEKDSCDGCRSQRQRQLGGCRVLGGDNKGNCGDNGYKGGGGGGSDSGCRSLTVTFEGINMA